MKLDIKTPAHQEQKQKSRGFFWGGCLIFLGIGCGILFFTNQSLSTKNAVLEKSITNIQSQIDQAQADGTSLKQLVASEQALIAAQKFRVSWSKIMKSILLYEHQNVRFKNFTVSNDGQEVQISAQAKTLADIKNIIALLKNSPDVKNEFVPLISRQRYNDDFPIQFELNFLLPTS